MHMPTSFYRNNVNFRLLEPQIRAETYKKGEEGGGNKLGTLGSFYGTIRAKRYTRMHTIGL